MASDQGKRRRGGIRERGGVYQVRVYVGIDPVTGERVDLLAEGESELAGDHFVFSADPARHAPQTASPTATGGWPRTSASTPTSTPYATTALLSCCPQASICARLQDGSVTETALRHCASTPPG